MRVQSVLLSVCALVAIMTSPVKAFESEGVDFNGDFFQGMESGFFLRDTQDGHREYDCPDPSIDHDAIKQINGIIGPIRMLLQMVDNEYLTTIFDTIDLVMNTIFSFIAIFEGYKGSEFCQGLLFGVTGSNVILAIGRELLSQIEDMQDVFASGAMDDVLKGVGI